MSLVRPDSNEALSVMPMNEAACFCRASEMSPLALPSLVTVRFDFTSRQPVSASIAEAASAPMATAFA